MFSLFNKNKKHNPIAEVVEDLTSNQKKSVLNLLLMISVCDGDQGGQLKELEVLNSYVEAVGVRSDESMRYLERYGHERIFDDLITLTKSQKDFLVFAAWEMIICDGRPNETELNVTGKFFERIGVSEDEFVSTIEKKDVMMKHFSRK